MNNQNMLVILSGGAGIRYGRNIPKQYTLLNGKELISYSIDEMLKSTEKDKLILVLNNDPVQIKRLHELYPEIDIIPGGEKRVDSFQNAIDYIKKAYPGCRKIIFQESARPLVTHKVIDEYFSLLDEYDYVQTCQRITDSLGSYVVTAPRREDYYLIQSPEAYRFSVLTQYYDHDSDIYYAGNQFPSFLKGYQCFDVHHNVKLTNPEDKALIEYLLTHDKKSQ